MLVAVGITSHSSSSRFGATSTFNDADDCEWSQAGH
jgi:hypothetical protein